jgi:hypothetical protein
MTEQEYINVRNLSNVMHARAILSQICLGNQSTIPQEEFVDVLRKLSSWEQAMFEIVNEAK